jgi:septum formation protein
LAAVRASVGMRRLVLASASPRREALLRQAGIPPDQVVAAEIDERAAKAELPADLVRRLAERKAEAVFAGHGDAFVLAADTVVAVGRRILGKPADDAAARDCLQSLSGRRHRVLTAVAVSAPDRRRARRLVVSTVAFKRLDQAEMDWYLATEEWRGKAGGYAIQGRASRFVRWLSGSYSNVVGLPIYETVALLDGLGYPVRRQVGNTDGSGAPG